MLQEIITDPGLFHAESENWQLVYGKQKYEFRGEGIAHTKAYSHHSSTVSKAAVHTHIRSKRGTLALRITSGHIPHHATIPQTEAILSTWEGIHPRGRTILGFDANETFTPPSTGATGCHATTGRGAITLDWLEHAGYTLPPQQLRTPSYYPYNPLMQPRRLDYIATRGITPGEGKVHPCRDRAASDHDAVAVPVGKHKGGGPARATWGPRRLRPPHQVQQLLVVSPPKGEDTHQVLSALAHAITVPGGGTNKFRESDTLKQMRKAAQTAPAGPAARTAWKGVARQRKREQRAWTQQQATQAAQLDWRAMRSLHTQNTHKGWHLHLRDDPQWQQHLGDHMQTIFAKPRPSGGVLRMAALRLQLRRRCKHTPWQPFTHAELLLTSHKWGNNKSTGPDGISHEAARALLADPAWGGRIAYLLNDMFYTAKVPEAIDKGVTVLLPKVPHPLQWGDTRPITLSSTILKWASQLLLHRAGGCIRGGSALQWARAGRQGVELIATIRRVTQMARDWGVGTWLVKLDIRKAFDSVWQHSMGELVAAKVGGVGSERAPVPEHGGNTHGRRSFGWKSWRRGPLTWQWQMPSPRCPKPMASGKARRIHQISSGRS